MRGANDEHRESAEPVEGRLRRILGDERLLGEVAASSFLHPNGFVRLIVGGDGREFGERIRLHLWPSDIPPKRTDIHNHCWQFRSTVLAGRVEVDTWGTGSVMADAGDAREHMYEVGSLRAPSVRDVGPVSLAAPVRRSFDRGDSYESDPGTFHRVSAAAGTVTSVHQGRHVRITSQVIAHDAPSPYTPVRSTPEETAQRLQEVLRLIQGS